MWLPAIPLAVMWDKKWKMPGGVAPGVRTQGEGVSKYLRSQKITTKYVIYESVYCFKLITIY
jgi:hypothetical protein